MAETTKTRADLITQYADNFAKEISAEDLRDFVASVEIYGELSVNPLVNQTFGTVASAMVFNTDGLFFGVTPDQANDKIIIDFPGRYNFNLQGTAMLQNGRSYTFQVFKNGAFLCELGRLTGDTNVPELSYGFGCLADLVATDEIQIFVTASADGSNFDNNAGSRVYIERKMGALI